jgi:hypothetical protein
VLVRRVVRAHKQRRTPPTSSLTSDATEAAATKNKGERFRWSEAGWWAWEELDLRLHPETKIARVPTGSAAREPSLARHAVRFSSLVAATSHGGLISNHALTAMNPAFSQVAGDRQGRSNALSWGTYPPGLSVMIARRR